MVEDVERPDPDVLLRQMQEEAVRQRRGKLKIFFGFAPGVGKTYRMLQVARDLLVDQQRDVVVGVVEDHRRPETAQLAMVLERIPPREVSYRGRVLQEFDLDAALARKPQLLLLDELAHTNAPESRNAKRWQDAEELLDAGIDVLTTMNVQHVESLNDVVAQITGIQVRETVPDSVLDEADALELVDIAPEELLSRLAEGKVYLPAQAQRAAQHFFRRGNLLALRELSLRRTAQRVGGDVLGYREAHGVTATWAAGERILVCVGPAPSSARLVRAAARMAAGLRCPWVAASVEVSPARPLGEVGQARLEAHLRLAESLGGTLSRLSGPSVHQAILAYARRHNVTRLIIGKPTHPRLWDRLRGSLLEELVRGSGDIEVHVISGSEEAALAPAPLTRAPPRRSAYGGAALIVGVSTLATLLMQRALSPPDLEMLFLLGVMAVAVWLGRGPAILAAALSVASYDFFFVEPVLSFSASDRSYLLTFSMMFAVGVVMSALAGRLRRQQQEAMSREERTAALYELTRELASTRTVPEIAAIAARHAIAAFGGRAVVLCLEPSGALRPVAAAPPEASLGPRELTSARWASDHGAVVGLGTDTLAGGQALIAALAVGDARLGALALLPPEGRPLTLDQRALFDVICRQTAAALDRARLAEEARQAEVRARTEELRSSLLSSVSHDLRTPLGTITGAATSLRDAGDLSPTTRRELLESIVDEAERLERLVGNLLDMTRLDAGGLELTREWVPLDELIGSALTRMERRLGERPITVALAEDVPLVHVELVLFEQVLINLLENAVKYTPDGSPLRFTARREGEGVRIELRDAGPGLPAGEEARVFEKFVRGSQAGPSGAGLGLAICRAIVEAHGGKIHAENLPEGGACFVVALPIGGAPPPVELPGVAP